MKAESQRPGEREGAVSALNAAIGTLSLSEKDSTIVPAKTVFGSVIALLTTIRDSMTKRPEYVELGLSCAGVCQALDQGMNGKKPDELAESVHDAIVQLTLIVGDIRRKLVEWDKRGVVSRLFHVKNDKKKIATWGLDFDSILQVFNDITDSAIHHDVTGILTIASDLQNDATDTPIVVSDSHNNTSESSGDTHTHDRMDHISTPEESLTLQPGSTHETVSDTRRNVVQIDRTVSDLEHNVMSIKPKAPDVHRTMVKGQEGSDDINLLAQTSTLGELPLPALRACFGRSELIEEVVDLAENLTPTALIGSGGIGKTSVALAVLHHDRIKQRFGDNRRFLRCDQFPPTLLHFLRRLSKVIGAGAKNPENITPLRPFLSSQDMFIVLDNAESILDPRGANAQEIYAVVEELSQFKTISLCVTSRIATVPRHCTRPTIPALSIEAASDIFYGIYENGGRSDVISDLLQRSDFHPLSITLLATTASHNMWDYSQLAQEWDARRTEVLQTDYDGSLAATIELSLVSPTFGELGPDARDLLGVIAFFPQGIDENNLDWLFPTIPERKNIFDKLCVLSLTHRNNGFITMLAPLREYLCPRDPKSAPLLCTTRDLYFSRLSVRLHPGDPGFEETQWITSEDVNVEHLLDIFTSIDADTVDVWEACAYFMRHLYWHKKQLVMLGPKIEGLQDDHPSKPECLLQLSRLYDSAGNHAEYRRLLIQTLKLWRERGDDFQVAHTLRGLSDASRLLGLRDEGIQQAREASEVYERLGNTVKQAPCLVLLAHLLYDDKQLDAAKEAASRAIDLIPEEGNQLPACQSHRILGNIHRSKGDTKEAIQHYEVALGIASSFNWPSELFWVHYNLAGLFRHEDRFSDAHTHVEQAKSHAANTTYHLGRVMELQAGILYKQGRLEEARSEILGATDVYEKFGATKDVEKCRRLLRNIQEKQSRLAASGRPGSNSQGTV